MAKNSPIHQSFTIQNIPFTIDPGDDGMIIYIGAQAGEMACATVFLEVDEDGTVTALLWDELAETAAAHDHPVEPVRVQLLCAAQAPSFQQAALVAVG